MENRSIKQTTLTSAADRSLTVPLYGERRHTVKQGQLAASMQRFRGLNSAMLCLE